MSVHIRFQYFIWLRAPSCYSGYHESPGICVHKRCNHFPSSVSSFIATLEDIRGKRSWLHMRMELHRAPGKVTLSPQRAASRDCVAPVWKSCKDRTKRAGLIFKLSVTHPIPEDQTWGFQITNPRRPNNIGIPTKCSLQIKPNDWENQNLASVVYTIELYQDAFGWIFILSSFLEVLSERK